MTGIRLSGRAVVPPGCDDLGFAFIATGSVDERSVWLASHSTANVEILNSGVSSPGGVTAQIGDPIVSPDNCTVAFTTIPNLGTENFLTTVLADDSAAATDIASEPNSADDGTNASVSPWWSPNSQRIVFASLEGTLANTGDAKVKRVDADGTNPVTLYADAYSAGNGACRSPQYSDDGSKILFYRDGASATANSRDIYTMDDDGANVVLVASTAPWTSGQQIPCWLAGTTTVVYYTTTGGSATAGNPQFRSVEADGTGDTLLYQDPEALVSVQPWGTTAFASLPDGSAVLALQYFPGDTAGRRFRLGTVDAGGGGWTETSPQRRSSGSAYQTRVPVLRQGRVWWTDGYLDGVVSIATDGSDYTVEDNTEVIRGWFGIF